MKKEFKLNRLFVSMLVSGCFFSFTACNNDDEVTIPPMGEATIECMYGNYAGKMYSLTLVPNEGEGENSPAGTDISSKVDNDTIYFENFPIKDIVLSIVGDEAIADQIVEAVGNVNYKIGYEPTLTETKDSIKFVLNPEPLKLSVVIPAANKNEEAKPLYIEVKVSPADGANYEITTTNLKFKFNAEEVLLGEGEEQITLPSFKPTTFDFDIKKSKE